MRKSTSPMMRLVMLLCVGGLITIGLMFLVAVLGSTDDGAAVSMAGSNYSSQYDSITEVSIIGLILTKPLIIIVAVCSLIVAVVGLKKYTGF